MNPAAGAGAPGPRDARHDEEVYTFGNEYETRSGGEARLGNDLADRGRLRRGHDIALPHHRRRVSEVEG